MEWFPVFFSLLQRIKRKLVGEEGRCRCYERQRVQIESSHTLGGAVKKMCVYYESIKRELNKGLIFDSRCDTRLKVKAEGCTRLVYTMWHEEP